MRTPGGQKPFLVLVLGIAFVALVLPFDSFRGLRASTRGPFFRAEESGRPGQPGDRTKRGKAIHILEV